MKVLVIVAHPNRASFNHAIAQTCSRALTDNGHEVIAHDLYEEHFNPMLPYGEFPKDAVLPADIKQHCDEVSQADGIVIIHPNWWGAASGNIERVGGQGNPARSSLRVSGGRQGRRGSTRSAQGRLRGHIQYLEH